MGNTGLVSKAGYNFNSMKHFVMTRRSKTVANSDTFFISTLNFKFREFYCLNIFNCIQNIFNTISDNLLGLTPNTIYNCHKYWNHEISMEQIKHSNYQWTTMTIDNVLFKHNLRKNTKKKIINCKNVKINK